MFDRSLSYDKRLHFDRSSFVRHKIVRAQNVWSLTFLQQKTIFWSLSFRTTHDNGQYWYVERQLWTRSSPRCLISHFPAAKDYILIAFLSNDTRQFDCRTTVVNFIEPKMFDRFLSYDKRLHFDHFPSNDTRQYDCRTTVLNFIEPKMFDRSLSYDKRLHFDRFPSNDTRQYDCRTTVVNLIAFFRTTKDYILIAFLRTTQDSMIAERQLWTWSLSSERHMTSWEHKMSMFLGRATKHTLHGNLTMFYEFCFKVVNGWLVFWLCNTTLYFPFIFSFVRSVVNVFMNELRFGVVKMAYSTFS